MALLLAVHAHPDDESLWTGALLATWARAGEVELVTCTRGERGEVIGAELAHLEGDGPALAAHRTRELDGAVAALGVQRRSFLDELPLAADGASSPRPGGGAGQGAPTIGEPERLEDSGMAWLADGVAGPAADVGERAFVLADVDALATRLAAHLAVRRPAVVVTYGPDGGYGHPDHVRAHEVTMRAVAQLDVPPTVLWAVAPERAGAVRSAPGPRVEVPLAPVAGAVATAMRAHATQVQDVVVGDGTIDFALSNDVPLRLGPVEVFEPAPGSRWPEAWPAGVDAVDRPVP